MFHKLEDWKLDNEDQSRTVYLKRLTAYQRAVARLGYRASGGNEEAASNLFISGTGVNAYSRSIRDAVRCIFSPAMTPLPDTRACFRYSQSQRTLLAGYIRHTSMLCISSWTDLLRWLSQSLHPCRLKLKLSEPMSPISRLALR